MSVNCSKYLSHLILKILHNVHTTKGYLHNKLNPQNILLLDSKEPIVVGWSSVSPPKKISDVFYDFAEIYWFLLTGGALSKKKATLNKSNQLNEKEWKTFCKDLEKKKKIIVEKSSPQKYDQIIQFL